MSMWYVQVMGETLGPMPSTELLQMAALGRVEQDTLVSHHDTGPWVTASHVKGLFDPSGVAHVPPAAVREAPAEPASDEVSAAPEPAPQAEPASDRVHTGPRPYKVLTQRDKWFGGRFDPDRLEDAINAYASDGWQVCGMATTMFATLAGKREEVVVLMHKNDAHQAQEP